MRVICGLMMVLAFATSCKQEVNKEKPSDIKENKSEITTKEVDTTNMVYFDGGTITIGSENGLPNEQATFEKAIEPFYIDKNLVTVAEFRVFVEKTGYVTEAENFGDSGIFSFETGTWSLIKGANWMLPEGPLKEKANDDHPVTHVSWNDARTYAYWLGKRLPTEFEWEFAAKSGEDSSDKYAWGNELVIDGEYMANVWQGNSASTVDVKDGYLLTSPVGVYGETKSGLTDMGGNVWQWCETIYESNPGSSTQEPSDPKVRSTRGGSFMFDQALENSFTTSFRGKNSVDTSLFNLGFRCAK